MKPAIIVDVYQLDGVKDWHAYIAAGAPFAGAIFKLAQGTYYSAHEWAAKQRAAFVASPRYGVDLVEGFYDFVDLSQSGREQADYFQAAMERAGGEQRGTMPAMFDVERGGQKAGLVLTKTLIEHVVGECLARYKYNTGREPSLYGGELFRSTGARMDACGAVRGVIASYGPHLTADVITRTGIAIDKLELWQYRGSERQDVGPIVDGEPLPMAAPGCGLNVDMNVVTAPGGLADVIATLPGPKVLT